MPVVMFMERDKHEGEMCQVCTLSSWRELREGPVSDFLQQPQPQISGRRRAARAVLCPPKPLE